MKESAGEVTVSMSLKDDFAYSAAPRQFRPGSTGIEAATTITLKADRAALDTRVVLTNPQDKALDDEYWTCTTLARRDRTRKHPETTGSAEIIAPIQAYTTPRWSANLAEGDQSLGLGRSRFERLRYFRNWPTMGIAYAAPDMQGGNFWGVINHDNEEGIIRIADNTVTRGLKMWTWGFQSFTNEADARRERTPGQPYVELWAGVSDQFFHNAHFPALGEVSIPETYSPTVGMSNVTDANANILVNLMAEGGERQPSVLQYRTGRAVARHVEARRCNIVRRHREGRPERRKSHCRGDAGRTSAEPIRLTIRTADGNEELIAGPRHRSSKIPGLASKPVLSTPEPERPASGITLALRTWQNRLISGHGQKLSLFQRVRLSRVGCAIVLRCGKVACAGFRAVCYSAAPHSSLC